MYPRNVSGTYAKWGATPVETSWTNAPPTQQQNPLVSATLYVPEESYRGFFVSGDAVASAATATGTIVTSPKLSGVATAPNATSTGTLRTSPKAQGSASAPVATATGTLRTTPRASGIATAPTATASGTLRTTPYATSIAIAPTAIASGTLATSPRATAIAAAPAATATGTIFTNARVTGTAVAFSALASGTVNTSPVSDGTANAPLATAAGAIQTHPTAIATATAPAAIATGTIVRTPTEQPKRRKSSGGNGSFARWLRKRVSITELDAMVPRAPVVLTTKVDTRETRLVREQEPLIPPPSPELQELRRRVAEARAIEAEELRQTLRSIGYGVAGLAAARLALTVFTRTI